mmetsp:Transcript_53189/g.47829  ORF Transcript_53189/g.47829 Transcript_53189/m.47829 type:complete len:371 (+) Transcript_53189:21-1133(+)
MATDSDTTISEETTTTVTTEPIASDSDTTIEEEEVIIGDTSPVLDKSRESINTNVNNTTISSNKQLDLDRSILSIKQCIALSEAEIKQLCQLVSDVLMEEANVQPILSPVTICGDIHGQFFDILELLRIGGQVEEGQRYIFMGDFVDRGYHSVETLSLLFLLKARYTSSITLLRGNHESRQVTRVYGFYEEILTKYGNANVWRYCTDVFDLLPIGALVNGTIFCVHGGLSPDIATLDHLSMIDRKQEIPHAGAFADLMWSDPEDILTWGVSPRGAGWLFGKKVARQFNQLNGLQLICRAHQLVQDGYKYHFDKKNVITVWSAPNYVYRCGNVASILSFDENLNRDIKIFKDTEQSRQVVQNMKRPVPYFL